MTTVQAMTEITQQAPIPAVFSRLDQEKLRQALAKDAAAPLDTQRIGHRHLLGSVLYGLSGVDDPSPSKDWIRTNALMHLARMHGFISRGVPVILENDDVLENPSLDLSLRTPSMDAHSSQQVGALLSLIHKTWPVALAPALDLVVRGYIEQGYMDLTWAGENFYLAGKGYLETACYGSNPAVIPTLIEFGARLEHMPARLMEVELAGEWRVAEPGDYKAFLKIMFGDNPAHPVNLAIVEGMRRRQAQEMRQVIDEAIPTSVEAAAAAAPSGRARRVAL